MDVLSFVVAAAFTFFAFAAALEPFATLASVPFFAAAAPSFFLDPAFNSFSFADALPAVPFRNFFASATSSSSSESGTRIRLRLTMKGSLSDSPSSRRAGLALGFGRADFGGGGEMDFGRGGVVDFRGGGRDDLAGGREVTFGGTGRGSSDSFMSGDVGSITIAPSTVELFQTGFGVSATFHLEKWSRIPSSTI